MLVPHIAYGEILQLDHGSGDVCSTLVAITCNPTSNQVFEIFAREMKGISSGTAWARELRSRKASTLRVAEIVIRECHMAREEEKRHICRHWMAITAKRFLNKRHEI